MLLQVSGGSIPNSESKEARERRLWPRSSRVEPLRFRTAPLLAAAIAFAAGDALTQLPHRGPGMTLLLVVGTLLLVALTQLALRRAVRVAVPAVLALWLAAGLWSAQLEPSPAPQSALLAYADGLSRTVQARVTRIRTLPARNQTGTDFDPDQWEQEGSPATSLDLDVVAIEDVTPDLARMVPVKGGLRATLYAAESTAPMPEVHCGDVVELPLRLRAPERYRDPGVWQYADYLLDQNIAATASTSAAKLRVLPGSRAGMAATFHCRAFAAQSWASARLLAYIIGEPNRHLPALLRLTPDDAAMLNAMLFGDRSRLTRNLRLGFERTGSFHLFVVSGMHVALLAALLLWIARRLNLQEWAASLLTLTLTSLYALLTGFGVPVERALLMTAVFLLARLLFRERNVLNALGAAALAVLVGSPHALFEASFQMTFLAIVAIAGIAMPLGERSFLPYAHAARNLYDRWRDSAMPPRLAQFRVMLRMWSKLLGGAFGIRVRAVPKAMVRSILFVAELGLIGVVAEAVMVLPMAIYFHRATVFALPANMVSVPLVAVMAALGIATFLLSLLSPHLAACTGTPLALLLHFVGGIVRRLSGVQAADLRLPGPSVWHALLALACFGGCCWAVRRTRSLALLPLLLLPVGAIIALWPIPPAIHPGQLEVTAIDVGQGDSLLVVSPDGHTMLVDAGGPTGAAANAENATGLGSDGGFDTGEEVVSPYLWSRHLGRLDVVALTHAHSDHMGGMPAVLRNFRPRELWVAVDPDSPQYRALLDEAQTLGIRVRHLRAGDRIPWGGAGLSVLSPQTDYLNSGLPVNNDSLVMRIVYGHSAALLEGDAEAPSEYAMAAASVSGSGPAVGPDTLLKVGHHGSRTSTTPEFLALAAPQDAVISVGRNNTFGHPRPEIVARLAAAHAKVFRTDEYGVATFLLSADGGIAALPAASNP